MAEILDEISVGEVLIIQVGSEPGVGGGTDALEGSIAILQDEIGANHAIYQKSGPNPTDWVRVITGNLLTTNISYTESYTFERNGTTTGYLAIGNGAFNDGGVYLPKNGRIIKLSATTDTISVNATYEARINKVGVATLVFNGDSGSTNVNVPVNEGDLLTAFAVSGTGGANPQTVTITVEYDFNLTALQGPQGLQGVAGSEGSDGVAQFRFGSGVPSNGLGNDSDAYFNTDNGDYYTKIGGAWSFQFNSIGPTGPAGAPTDWIKLTNVLTTNANSSSGGIQWPGLNTTPLENTLPGLFTVSSNSITVNQSGEYDVYINLFQTTSSNRTNVGVDIQINGSPTNRLSASSYIRNNSGHNESSTNICEPFVLNAGDVISFRTTQLASTGTVTTPSSTSLVWVKKIG